MNPLLYGLYTNASNSEEKILLIGELSHHISHICLSSLAPSSWLSSYSCYSMGTGGTLNKPDDTFPQPWPLHYLALPTKSFYDWALNLLIKRTHEPSAPAWAIRVCCIIERDTCTLQVFGGRPIDIWLVGESFLLLQKQRGIAEEGCHY